MIVERRGRRAPDARHSIAVATPASVLLELGVRPDWWRDAACQEHPWRLFFPQREDSATGRRAKEVCGGCLVLAECRQWALEADGEPELVGIFGGLTTRERRAMRRQSA